MEPSSTGVPIGHAPSFYVTGRQPIRPAAVLLAVLIAAGTLGGIGYAMGHARRTGVFGPDRGATARRDPRHTGDEDDEDKDDPSQVDVIVLGDPADAPVPARRGGHASSVHPTILIRLPRFGDQVGLIPNSPTGHLLYAWLAAFNQASEPALRGVLPSEDAASTAAAQLVLRTETGGFNLLSAREIQPGLLVFRLRDQTPAGAEALGTLQMRPGSDPPAIATFSLRDAGNAN